MRERKLDFNIISLIITSLIVETPLRNTYAMRF